MLNFDRSVLSEGLRLKTVTQTVTEINTFLTSLTPKEKQAVRPQLEVLKRILEINLNEVEDEQSDGGNPGHEGVWLR